MTAVSACTQDGDNSLDPTELKAVADTAGYSISDAELEEVFKGIDTDGNGKVDFAEFKNYWESNVVESGCVILIKPNFVSLLSCCPVLHVLYI